LQEYEKTELKYLCDISI